MSSGNINVESLALPLLKELDALYGLHGGLPLVQEKRALWSNLLTQALGKAFVDSDELFVAHSLLILIAKGIARALIGLDLSPPDRLFELCAWPEELPGGEILVKNLHAALGAFAWEDVERDILRGLYEKVIGAARRKQLGEYYTPDWLAECMVNETIQEPLSQRVLDPSCGSGTFLFYALRHSLKAAERAGQDCASALSGVFEHIWGMDIHPISLVLARVNYLLALGPKRLQYLKRPFSSIPVFSENSLLAQAQGSEQIFDILIGNPPWLSYRFMTADMQAEFRDRSKERGLWAGAAVATNQDLSTFFVVRSMERYLRKGGRFAFVMPWSILRGRQHIGFRTGRYSISEGEALSLCFERAWDLQALKPSLFPVPCCVIKGQRAQMARPLGQGVEAWTGKLPRANMAWEEAQRHIRRTEIAIQEAMDAKPGTGSPYETRFAQGATMVPRFLVLVEQGASGFVRSRRSAQEKKPWKDMPSLEGHIEMQFVRPMHLGETILPYRVGKALKAIVPWDGKRLLHGLDEHLAHYPDLEQWWRQAEALWDKHKSSERLSLIQRIDYQKGLSDQFPIAPLRVVYTKSGMHLAAAILKDKSAVIDHALYWGVVGDMKEALYLEAILNSAVVTERVRPLQARGQFGPRHYDKYIWHLPIPYFDEGDARHLRLSHLAAEAEKIAGGVVLPEGGRFEHSRGLVRQALEASEVGREIEREVEALMDENKK